MTSEKLYQIDRLNIVFEIFENEVVIINLDNGSYYSYGGAGVDIWKSLQNEISITQIVKILSIIYPSSDRDNLLKIVLDSIEDLKKESLITSTTIYNSSDKNTLENISSDIKELKGDIIMPSLQRYTDMKDFLLVDPIHEIDYEKWPEKDNKKSK